MAEAAKAEAGVTAEAGAGPQDERGRSEGRGPGTPGGPASGATIVLENLTKRYPGNPRPAVESVSMEIKAGETVILVGPSGCGKSTTLKMINRLIEPSSGRIRIGDEDVTAIDPVKLRRKVGYAIQSSGLFPHMTVAENIALVPKMVGWGRTRVRDRVEEMLDLVGLDPREFHGRYPRQLSGGQQQRVGVARALAADPPVLLMDEPFGAVDPITRDHLQDELIRLQRDLHKTIVFVTHDFDEAIKLGDRIAVLRERSHIAQFDTPEAILTNPADEFVSGFVGAGAALKRLNLTRVRDVEIADFAAVTVDEPLQSIVELLRAGQHNELLLLDHRRRPYKWLRRGDLLRARGSLARSGTLVTHTVTRDATLRDALEAVLTDSGGRVAVTGRRGEFIGVVDMETLMNSVHEMLEADRLTALEHRHELDQVRTGREQDASPVAGDPGGDGEPPS
ncbi:osmoprotectant transport system ATP-binding protein [Actinacidiphila yanglinensis]|uniref:ABC-type quaternary amine transporter n=1 Tax=Actinacidiphila yanglinensis TaxID=310779 RepID=A0A1H6D2D8_9ACTN|nr:osmoprotectant transport system ATP-binding protein [Actinacidiphila yanglinensis]